VASEEGENVTEERDTGEFSARDDREIRIPVLEETLALGKRVIETGGYRIVKSVSEREASASAPVVHESVVVERVNIDRLLDPGEPLPAPRTEGDSWIVPLCEEVLVVEKRVRLTEELRVRRVRTEMPAPPQTVTLRKESVTIERLDPDGSSPAMPDTNAAAPSTQTRTEE
jgi:uncharacterized protein (TIGR02271 family)